MTAFLSGAYLWIKALHVISVIAWMAGMMYLPRLFIYHLQSEKGGEAERYFIQMERRLMKGIINPSIVAVWLFGILMLTANPALISTGWFGVKLAMVLALSAIHGFYAASAKKFEAGERPRTQKFWRIMNEVPFLLMIVVVFMVIAKPF